MKTHVIDMPSITIGMTCFNSADTISAAIISAIKQDYPNFDILIVDDGSEDESVRVIEASIKDYPKARLIVHEQNRGFAGALNTLISNSCGEYLAIFDDDDESVPDRLSRQIKRIKEYEHHTSQRYIVCHTARVQKYPDGSQFYEPTAGCVDGIAPHGAAMAERILIGRLSHGVIGSCANCSRMASLDTFKLVNGFDASMRRCEDTDFNVRLALAGGHFIGLPDPLVIQTMTSGSDKTLDREYSAERSMIEKHKGYLTSIGWFDFCMRWLEVKYSNLRGDRLGVVNGVLLLGLSSPVKLLKKLYWTIPARRTRNRLVKWYGEMT